jgi:hypothetical protein
MSQGRKFELGSSSLCARLFGERDSRLVEGNHQVSVHELPVLFDQFLVGSFVPVFGWTPLVPESLPNVLRLIEVEVLVNGTPRAI